MKCAYCAEQIQDEAIVCRYCGAEKVSGNWVRAASAAPGSEKPSFFFRSSGLLFILSAGFELWSVTNPVPLLGEIRGGLVAPLYHSLFVAIFLAIGIGLWRASSWGYQAVLAGSVIYSADRLLFVLDDASVMAVLSEQLGNHPELMKMIDAETLAGPLLKGLYLTMLLGFWFFVFLVHRRRSEFKGAAGPA